MKALFYVTLFCISFFSTTTRAHYLVIWQQGAQPQTDEVQIDDTVYHHRILKNESPAAESRGHLSWRAISRLSPVTESPSATHLLSLRSAPSVYHAEYDQPAEISLVPFDPEYPNQGHHTILQSEQAWDVQTDCTSVVTAVIDTGINATHPDLNNVLWQNEDEIAGNGLDDDQNGYVDDVQGACVRADCSDWDVTDGSGHGTHVAGIIGANTHNGVGTSGLCWQSRLMVIKALGSNGTGSLSDVVAGINYATQNGAQLMNISLTIGSASLAMRAAIEAAEQAGILVVAAAGNSSLDNDQRPQYPASYRVEYDHVFSLAATNDLNQLASVSNYGRSHVDMAAPGQDILSTYPMSLADSGYKRLTGTSMATPMATATAALLLAQNSESTPQALKAQMMATGTRQSSLDGRLVVPAVLNTGASLSSTSALPVLFRTELENKQYLLSGARLASVSAVRFTEPRLDGNRTTEFSDVAVTEDGRLQLSLNEATQHGYFTVSNAAGDSNALYIRRPLSAPMQVHYEATENGLLLNWENPVNAETLTIERGTDSIPFQVIGTVSAPSSVFLDTGFDAAQTHRYRIQANYRYFNDVSQAEALEYSIYSPTVTVSPGDTEDPWLSETLATLPISGRISIPLQTQDEGVFELASGTLPPGLQLNSNGLVSGTPTQTGTFDAVIRYLRNQQAVFHKPFTMQVIESTPGLLEVTSRDNLQLEVQSANATPVNVQSLHPATLPASYQGYDWLQIGADRNPASTDTVIDLGIRVKNTDDGRLQHAVLRQTDQSWTEITSVSGAILQADTLNLLITDGSVFDLDGAENGSVQIEIALQGQNNTRLTQSSSSSRCFIASTVYPTQPDKLNQLRHFRDTWLLTHTLGQWLTARYYEYSPAFAHWLEQHAYAQQSVRWILDGSLWLATNATLVLLGLVLVVAGWWLTKTRSRQFKRERPVAA